MSQIQLFFFAVLVWLPATASSSPHVELARKQAKAPLSGAIAIGNSAIGMDSDGGIKIHTSEGILSIPVDSLSVPSGPSDHYFAPCLLQGPSQPVFGNEDALFPMHGPRSNAVELLNHLGFFFSTASGGFGFRINYDHALSPHIRLTASPEFLTYGLLKAQSILRDLMPASTTRITLIALPIGLQRHFAPTSRINPYVGFGAGPIVRLDHRARQPGYYPYNYPGFSGTFRNGRNQLGVTVPLSLDELDFPSTSLTLGGHVASGMNIHFGAKKDLALTIEGRYTLARFVDALGSPGDFSGFSAAVGFGKAF